MQINPAKHKFNLGQIQVSTLADDESKSSLHNRDLHDVTPNDDEKSVRSDAVKKQLK